MKKLLVGVFAVALVTASATAYADCGKVWDDLSWWGNTGATPAVVKDATRSGYWWWPTTPASNDGDSELWGNRGLVYSQYTPPKPPETKGPETPPPPPPKPKVLHKKTVFNDVLFDFDKSNIRPTEIPTLDHVVAELKKYKDDTVEIQGHTCNVGSEAYNQGLGQRRADAVMKYLVEHGIDAKRIKAVSLGETKPAVPNDTPANRKLNRRGVFIIDIKTYVEQ